MTLVTTDKDVNMSPLTCNLFLIIIIVARGEQVAKNESWDVHLLVLVLHHRYSFTIVPDRNGVGLTGGGRIKVLDELQRLYQQNMDTDNLKYINV